MPSNQQSNSPWQLLSYLPLSKKILYSIFKRGEASPLRRTSLRRTPLCGGYPPQRPQRHISKNYFVIFSKSLTFANRRLYPKNRGMYSVAPMSWFLLMRR
jgi:hypothetical protein